MANGMNEGRLTSLLKRLIERVCDWVIAGVRKMRRAGAACVISANGTLQKSADWKRSAKRKLVGAEGVIITLALIASLGIVSPLVASAGEPAEASHPVSGVIGETGEGAATVDVDEDAEAVDDADSADSDDAVDSDAATDSDAAQDGDDDSASAGDSDGPAGDGESADADADGDGSVSASATESDGETDATDGDGDANGNANADEDEGVKVEVSDEEESDREKSSDIPEKYKTTTTFEEDGGQYNLGYLFSRYSLITFEDAADLPHMVGPILVGGTLNENNKDSEPGSVKTFAINNVQFHANTFIRGTGHNQEAKFAVTQYQPKDGSTSSNLYLGETYWNGSLPSIDGNSYFNKERNLFYTNDYFAFEDAKDKALAKANSLKDEGAAVTSGWSGNTLELQAGGSYVLDASLFRNPGNGSGGQVEHIVLNTIGVKGENDEYFDGEHPSKLPETIITIVNAPQNEQLVLPTFHKAIYGSNSDRKEYTLQGVDDGGLGIPIVWNLPDAKKILKHGSHGNHFGHVIAPDADAYVDGGNTNGCWMVKSIAGGAEGHMWPYNGKKLFPAETEFKAKKYLYDADGKRLSSLEGYTFQFELWDLKGDNNGANATEPDTSKHDLLETVTAATNGDITFNTHPSYQEIGTYHYLIVEKQPTPSETRKMRKMQPDVELIYDTHVEHVTVKVTSEMINGDEHFNAGVTIRPLRKPMPRNQRGATQPNGTQTIIFENRMRRREVPKASLQLSKQMAEGQTADANQEFKFDITLYVPQGTAVSDAYGMQRGTATEVSTVSFSKTSEGCPSDMNGCTVQKGTVSLKAGETETVTLVDLPDGAKYEVSEQETTGYELVGFNCDTATSRDDAKSCKGTLSGNEEHTPSAAIVATNRRITVRLSIKKEVEAWSNVPEVDQKKEFTFEVSLYDKDKNPLGGTYDYTITPVDSTNQKPDGGSLQCSANGSRTSNCGEIRLKHGQTATIADLPYGTRFVVTETSIPEPFEFATQTVSTATGVTCDGNGSDSQNSDNCQVTSTNGVLVTVTNRYSPKVVLPSTGGKAHPIMTAMFGLGVVCAGLAIAMLYLRRCE